MDNLASSFSNVHLSNEVPWAIEPDGTYRLPDTVDDMSGDPGEQYYVDPPSREALGRRWVVFRGTVPGIYNTWPGAEAQILGVSGANHKAFGTPQEAWRQYELQRRNNFVQRLPYVPPGAPPFPPIPQTPRRGNNQPATNRTPVTPSRPAPVTPAAARATSSDSSSQQGDPFTPPPRSSKGKASMYGKKVQTPTSLHEQPAAGPSNCSPSPLRFTRNPRDVVPPWEANSHVFVVFEGAPPGLYSSWTDMRAVTKDTHGPVYRGYEFMGDAVEAFAIAQQAGLLRNI